eukprot:TRINITY_DN8748_c0_g1_i13.p1 TRINITY_DN8748_c0_g1~~TRINITY_DN8748_c0_g1_i13.p1  ORF type:complete len:102 (-),score=3.39 TRINITY_DN8748_c0_g1_i13:138-443(-)
MDEMDMMLCLLKPFFLCSRAHPLCHIYSTFLVGEIMSIMHFINLNQVIIIIIVYHFKVVFWINLDKNILKTILFFVLLVLFSSDYCLVFGEEQKYIDLGFD